jgi:hypothetical protein
MEKIFKILIVFGLLMFVIVYSIRTRRWREYAFSGRLPEIPPAEDEPEDLSSVISHQGIAVVTDEATGLVYQYNTAGVLTISMQHSSRELQRLAVPPGAYYLSFDGIKDEIHLHYEGEIYIYTRL